MRALLTLAWPVVVARATQSVIGFSDALMVAPVGETALAAATTGAVNAFALIILPMGTVFIVQSFASQLRGRGELEATPRYAWYGLAIALLAGALAALVIPGIPPVLRSFAFAPEVSREMGAYLSIRLLAVTAVVGMEALGNWYAGLGHTRPAMFAGLVTMVVNLVGNYVLIEARFGLPGYGVRGAAWASVIASAVGLLVLLLPFLRGMGYEKSPAGRQLSGRELARVLRFGLPNGVNWFLEFAAFAVFINVIVSQLGTTVLAALNVVIQINSVAFMPAFGLASAGAILVGEAIGRGAPAEVGRMVRTTAGVAAVWTGSVGLVYVLLPHTIIGWFSPPDAASDRLVEIGAVMLAISAAWQLFDAVGLTIGEALRAAGDTTWCMVARIVLAWVVFVPASWLAVDVLDGGVVAVMVVLAGYIALLAIAFAMRFASGAWRRIELVSPATRDELGQ